MKKRRIVIELLTSRVDVAVYDGRRRMASVRLPAALGHDAVGWMKEARRFGSTLRDAVRGLGAEGLSATVYYRSPTEAVDLVGFAVRWPWQACDAARLSCTDALSYPLESAVCEAGIVGRDTGGEPRQHHAVVAAERNDVASAIVDMVEEAELTFDAAVPLFAAISARIGSELLAAVADSRSPLAMLYIAEHCSAFVLGVDGALTFSRHMSLGVDSLVTALTRPLRIDGRAGDSPAAGRSSPEPVTLDPESARRLLHEHGLPERSKVVESALGIRGHHIYPVLQPVLQRYVVELRQSLRFGVSEYRAPSNDRRETSSRPSAVGKAPNSEHREPQTSGSDLRIVCMGPGSAIPGFAQLLGEELGVPVETDARYTGYRYDEPAGEGSSLADAAADPRFPLRVNLQPTQRAHSRRMTRLRRWMWTGAATAIAMLAVDALRYAGRVEEARKQANVLVARTGDMETLRATGERLFTTVSAMNRLEDAIDREMMRRADFHAVMQELSRVVPDPVTLTSIRIRREEEHLVAGVSGFAFYLDTHQQTTALAPFITRLRESPLIESAVLGNVSTGTLGHGGAGERFEASLTLRPAPTLAHAATAVEAVP